MKPRPATKQIKRAAFARVGATSVAFFIPIIVAAAYLNLGQTCCSGNCPPPPPPDFLISRNLAGDPISVADASISADGTRIAYTLANQLYIYETTTGERRRVDPSSSGWGDSTTVRYPVLTADGSFVAFGHGWDYTDPWYVEEIWFGTADYDPDPSWSTIWGFGGTEPISNLTMSGDGSVFAFDTRAALLPEDTDDSLDVYVIGPDGLSFASGGGPPGDQYASASSPKLSLDGQWVTFRASVESEPFDFRIVLQRTDGTEATQFPGWSSSISADGSLVAYETYDTRSIRVFDRVADIHRPVDLDNEGNPSTGLCFNPSIDGGGRRVAFWCVQPLTSHGASDQVYVRDLYSEVTYLVSVNENREPANTGAWNWNLQVNGNYAIIETTASNFNFAPGDGGSYTYKVPFSYWQACDEQFYVPQETTCGSGVCAAYGATSCVNGRIVDDCEATQTGIEICNGLDDDCDGRIDEDLGCHVDGRALPATTYSAFRPSSDGSRVAFFSENYPPWSEDPPPLLHLPTDTRLLVRDVDAGTTIDTGVIVDTDRRTSPMIRNFRNLDITGDGTLVAALAMDEIVVVDLVEPVSIVESIPAEPRTSVSISDDGRYVAFDTKTQLVPGDTNDFSDVYIWDRDSSVFTRVDSEPNKNKWHAELSADGAWIAYTYGTTLTDYENLEVVVREVVGGAVSHQYPGYGPTLSDDGSRVVFTWLQNTSEGLLHSLWWREPPSGEWGNFITRRGYGSGSGERLDCGPQHGQISGDGRFVTFGCRSSQRVTPHTLETPLGTPVGAPPWDPYLQYVGYLEYGGPYASRVKLASISEDGLPVGDAYNPAPAQLSDDGAYLFFNSASNAMGPGDSYNHLYRVPSNHFEEIQCDINSHTPTNTTCGVGLCTSSGVESCVSWTLEDSCVPACRNGCDGEAEVVNCGTAPCIGSGVLVCQDGYNDETCQPDPSCESDTDLDGIPDSEDSCPLVHDMPPLSFDCADALPPLSFGVYSSTDQVALSASRPAGTTHEPTVRISGYEGLASPAGQLVILGAYGARTLPLRPGEAWGTDVLLRPNESNRIVIFAHYDAGPTEISEVNVRHISNAGPDSLHGTVVDESGQPIAGATVRGGGSADITDGQGTFELRNIDGQTTMLVQMTAAGYLPAATLVSLSIPNQDPITLLMDRETTTEILVGPGGGTLTTANGFELVVPPGALAPGQEVRLSERTARPSLFEYVGVEAVDITPDQDFLEPVTFRGPNVAGLAPGQMLLATGYDPNTGAGAIDLATVSDDGNFLEMQLSSVHGRVSLPLPAAELVILDRTFIEAEVKYKLYGTYMTSVDGLQVSVDIKECGSVMFESIVGGLSTPEIDSNEECDVWSSVYQVPACLLAYDLDYRVIYNTYESGVGIQFGVLDWEVAPLFGWTKFREFVYVPLGVLRSFEPDIRNLRGTSVGGPNCSEHCTREVWNISGCPLSGQL